jgi:hypothetical protein
MTMRRMMSSTLPVSLLIGLAGNVRGQDVSFRPAVNYPTGTLPVSVAVGDFNGDEVADLVVTNGNSNDVSVLLGNGDGTFEAAQTFGAGSYPRFVAVGDFNGDGMQDLAVANLHSFYVSVLLGNGDGTFQSAPPAFVGFDPGSVAVGDFNGDGVQDVVVASVDSYLCDPGPQLCNVWVLLGNGDGTFQTPQFFGAGDIPYAVAVGDFNGDGVQDLVVANHRSNDISVLIGNGDGTFQYARNFAAGGGPTSVAVGDFNGDGVEDLAVAYEGVFPAGGASVLLGNGDGSFQAAHYFVGPFSRPYSMAVGDFNGDGVEDLAVVADLYNFSVLLGIGDGTFQAARNFFIGSDPWFVAVGDFNGDGKPDIAVTKVSSNNVAVLINNTP